VDDSILILEGLRDRYESHHRAKIQDDALEAAARLSARYITDRHLPDKGIDLIDEAAARARINAMETPDSLKEMEKKLEEIRREKEAAVDSRSLKKMPVFGRRGKLRRISGITKEVALAQKRPSLWLRARTSPTWWPSGRISVFQLTGEESTRLLPWKGDEKRPIAK
jgi:ATP-dependent Clp protease ATP-binding subunit ClpC